MQAGFTVLCDSEQMLLRYPRQLQADGLLPSARAVAFDAHRSDNLTQANALLPLRMSLSGNP